MITGKKNSKMLIIYTDGSCRKHRSGWCFVDTTNEDRLKIATGFENGSTSNRAEMLAVIEALRYAGGRKCLILTDSMLVANGCAAWVWELELSGWKTSRGIDVANKDLWQEMHGLLIDANATVKWIKGKNPMSIHYEYNKLADFEAKRAAR